jgi:hypothetical protein
LEQYPERWVAIYDEQVVAAAPELAPLLKMLERQGIPRGRTFVEYLTAKDDLLIV